MLSVLLIHTNPEVGTIQSPILKGCNRPPWWYSGRDPTCQCMRNGLDPQSRRFHKPQSSSAQCSAQFSLCSRVREPQLLSTQAATTNAWVP